MAIKALSERNVIRIKVFISQERFNQLSNQCKIVQTTKYIKLFLPHSTTKH